jgi:hypothetical protein
MDYLKKAEKALEYLAETEEEYARLKALVKYAPERIKAFLAVLASESKESSQAGKQAAALASEDHDAQLNSFEEVSRAFFEIQEKRHRAELTIEMYRSVNSALKRGNI